MLPFIHVFGLSIPMYGICMFVGVAFGMTLVHILRKHLALSEDDFYSAIIWTILGGMIGAKLLYLIVEFRQIIENPGFLLNSITSGFVYYGGLIGAFLGFFFFSLRKKQTFLLYSDMFLPAIALGMVFGRIGCFLAGCCYGLITDSPLGVVFPNLEGTVVPYGTKLLPTQLFESAFCLLLFVALFFIFKKQKRHGLSTSVFCIGYGCWRFFIEFFRGDVRGNVGVLSTSQFISIFIILAGVLLLVLYLKKMTPEIRTAESQSGEESEEEFVSEDEQANEENSEIEEDSENSDETPVEAENESNEKIPENDSTES